MPAGIDDEPSLSTEEGIERVRSSVCLVSRVLVRGKQVIDNTKQLVILRITKETFKTNPSISTFLGAIDYVGATESSFA